jgi:hypothetical protein
MLATVAPAASRIRTWLYQWLFGPVASQATFRSWTNLHKAEYDKFMQYQRNHPFKLRPDEYYNDGRFSLNR